MDSLRRKLAVLLVAILTVFAVQQAWGSVRQEHSTLNTLDPLNFTTHSASATKEQTELAGLVEGVWRKYMPQNEDPDRRLFSRRSPKYHMLESDPELLEIERQLREKNLIHNPEVQIWMHIAAHGTRAGRGKALERLRTFLQAYDVEAVRKPDPYRPYGPASLLSQGDLHLLDQQDGTRWLESMDSPLTGVGIFGTQGGGKTRAIISICRQLILADPPRKIFIIDPKGELAGYADYLHAQVLYDEQVSFDLSHPPGTDYPVWLRQLMPQLGGIIGLIQSIELLQEAAEIALVQLLEYRSRTSIPAELSLKDIYTALPFVQDAYRARRAGYLDAARTGLNRILSGSGQMFACRSGVPLQQLFQTNTIFVCRNLTDELACRWLAVWLLYWKYFEAKPHTNQLRDLLVIDDATRFIGARGPGSETTSLTTPLGHILSVLRISGAGVCVSTQLPADVDRGVLALLNLILAVGGIHGKEHQDVLGNMMALDKDQRAALGSLVTRETVGFYARGAYRRPVHGWVPEVPEPDGAKP